MPDHDDNTTIQHNDNDNGDAERAHAERIELLDEWLESAPSEVKIVAVHPSGRELLEVVWCVALVRGAELQAKLDLDALARATAQRDWLDQLLATSGERDLENWRDMFEAPAEAAGTGLRCPPHLAWPSRSGGAVVRDDEAKVQALEQTATAGRDTIGEAIDAARWHGAPHEEVEAAIRRNPSVPRRLTDSEPAEAAIGRMTAGPLVALLVLVTTLLGGCITLPDGRRALSPAAAKIGAESIEHVVNCGLQAIAAGTQPDPWAASLCHFGLIAEEIGKAIQPDPAHGRRVIEVGELEQRRLSSSGAERRRLGSEVADKAAECDEAAREMGGSRE